MKFSKMGLVLLSFGSLYAVSALSTVDALTLSNTNSTNNDNSTINDNSTMLDINQGRTTISADIKLANLNDDIHSIWTLDNGSWYGYSTNSTVRDEISENYQLLDSDISASKATIVYALNDTQLEITIPRNPEDVTRLYPNGLSFHGANGDYLSPYNITCSVDGSVVTSVMKVTGDRVSLYLNGDKEIDYEKYNDMYSIYESDAYFVLCDRNIEGDN
ncbi:hypothetical protein MNB_SV-15-929 [hydrothermal vent metagenome]|uniref:Uncharacterized protein n=1 Tax=hydrothermal vent metagenome TaxID=652676 RepID=A0A1W1EKG9_9ZZZZ